MLNTVDFTCYKDYVYLKTYQAEVYEHPSPTTPLDFLF